MGKIIKYDPNFRLTNHTDRIYEDGKRFWRYGTPAHSTIQGLTQKEKGFVAELCQSKPKEKKQ